VGKLSFFPSAASFVLLLSFVFLLTIRSSPWPSYRHFAVRFPSLSFSRLFLSTALNLLSVLSNKVYGSGVDLYREKGRKRNSYVRAHSRSLCVVAIVIARHSAPLNYSCISPNSPTSSCSTNTLRDISPL